MGRPLQGAQVSSLVRELRSTSPLSPPAFPVLLVFTLLLPPTQAARPKVPSPFSLLHSGLQILLEWKEASPWVSCQGSAAQGARERWSVSTLSCSESMAHALGLLLGGHAPCPKADRESGVGCLSIVCRPQGTWGFVPRKGQTRMWVGSCFCRTRGFVSRQPVCTGT